ncbi:MAG: hypothetical protein OMM_03334 [Candidatus Magnetoglobus multicellularis str. Araruama]|uniref:Sulfatase-modifying factor enzyme-like domain-containing protein n=1 Tax=Candidatus Magnetoglobus multicellularis str. Araruama TaxID=890399 RepID=A0A1V1P658_9BACT|nr:MAG: hypothetical protein OMM_03334 [Candidatus Magnetoglobus multicellularis str. Araruama]
MSPYGVNDLVGNAEEWTDTKSSSSDNYYEIVGGSWNRQCEIFGLNFSRFISAEPSHKSKFLGFRCVSDNSHENMVKIPGGIFNSGGEKGFTLDILRKFSLLDKTIVQLISSQPEIVILNAYYIDKKEVSNSEYMEFLQIVKNKTKEIQQHFHPQAPSDKDYTPQYLYNQKYNKPDQPVIGVDWYDAYAYCSWKGKRLPTREEWENAAKGTHNNFYPWGNKYNEKYFQSDEKGAPDLRGLNNNDQSSYGVFDMASNVSEWTYDHSMNETQAIYGSSYKKGKLHEVYSVTFMHVIESKDYYSDETGFRCALTINEKN